MATSEETRAEADDVKSIDSQTTEEGEEVSLKKRFLRPQTLVSFLVAFVILYFLWTRFDIDVEETMELLGDTNVLFLLLSFASYYMTFPLRGWRWKVLLGNAVFTGQNRVYLRVNKPVG